MKNFPLSVAHADLDQLISIIQTKLFKQTSIVSKLRSIFLPMDPLIKASEPSAV